MKITNQDAVESEYPPSSRNAYSHHLRREHQSPKEVPIMNDPTVKEDERLQQDARDAHSATLDLLPPSDVPRSESRRKFLGNVRGAALAAATAGAIGFEPILGPSNALSDA